ncbi:AraC family transcriptional regulator [Pedobacter sp. HDW13]|uniref:AraC family transcriptional regulator n=1 Tax=Pedobacter sp. HDW13 TaxID=2714940 RepID=UPI00140D85F8|nr:helix-turn-helix domain-containing protein [Pedobacter sp. HDW13]QIL41202.1 AraC family transcriptional regulator [Pedobacter sp. HDW13]
MIFVSLLKLFLFVIMIFAGLAFIDWMRSKNEVPLNNLLGFSNLYIGLHAVLVFTVQFFFELPDPYEWLAPFSLMYGPFLYYVVLIIQNRRISGKQIIIHSALFLLFLLHYLLLIFLHAPGGTVNCFAKSLAIASLVSFTGYMVFSIHAIFKPVSGKHKAYRLIVVIGLVLLLFSTIIMFIGSFFADSIKRFEASNQILKFLICCCMFSGIWIIHRFQKMVRKDLLSNSLFKEIGQEDGYSFKSKPKYEKSLLSEKQLEIYLEKLRSLMEDEAVYLDKELSLDKLAMLMHVPRHHITQLLSLNLEMSFYQYVNRYRLKHAANLLMADSDILIDSISEQSGFNSRVSFNRHFKSVYGMPPSEFRSEK